VQSLHVVAAELDWQGPARCHPLDASNWLLRGLLDYLLRDYRSTGAIRNPQEGAAGQSQFRFVLIPSLDPTIVRARQPQLVPTAKGDPEFQSMGMPERHLDPM